MQRSPLLYVALGDSLTNGVGSFFAPGFVKLYAQMTEHTLDRKVIYRRFAKNGATTRDILNKLNNREIQKAIYAADIITITAGGNDLIDAGDIYFRTGNIQVFIDSLNHAETNMSLILNNIIRLNSKNKKVTLIRIINLYNPYPYLYEADEWIRSYNNYLYQFSSDNIRIANIYTVFYGHLKEYLTIDHVHPSAKGYQVIAHRLYALEYYPLTGFSPLG